FTLQRGGGFGGEVEWLINGLPFDPLTPMASPLKGSGELWTIENGGGGWVHPMHLHMEEHHVISRNGVLSPQITSAGSGGTLIDYSQTYGSVSNPDPGDNAKEDVLGLKPGESVVVFRQFRTFTGPYVAHCHNLAHEDHAMMFGWRIVDGTTTI
ncbi:MAG TPA: multicopper oxidase domain-containing protein, partial [Verrucomicrobiae bacterium]